MSIHKKLYNMLRMSTGLWGLRSFLSERKHFLVHFMEKLHKLFFVKLNL